MITKSPRGRRVLRAATAVVGFATVLAITTACSSSSTSSSSSSGSLTKLNVQTSWIPLVQFGGSYVAEKEGYYKDNGVDVNLVAGGPEVDSLAAVQSGKADIAMSNADTVAQANEKGADLVIVAAGFQKNPLAILSSAAKPINTPKDLEGKKIGVPTGDQASQDAIVKYNHLDASKITSVPVSFDVAPLVSGEVDGLWVFYDEQPIAYEEAAGKPGVTMLTADYGLDVYAQVYVVKKETLADASKKKAVEGFLKGEIEGWQNYVKDPTEAVDLTVNDYGKNTGLTVEEQTKQAKLQMDLLVTDNTKKNGLLTMTDEGIQDNLKTIKSLGITGATTALFDQSLLKDIYAGKNTIG